MEYSETDPVIPIKVETLLSNLDRKMDDLSRNISSIKESLGNKADRAEIASLASRVNDLQRSGSDIARRAEQEAKELSSKVDLLQTNTVKKDAIEGYSERIKANEKNTKLQWVALAAAWAVVLIEVVALILHSK